MARRAPGGGPLMALRPLTILLSASGAQAAAAARELGYPGVDVCMKPVFSSGSRGFRVLSTGADRRTQLLENRPGVSTAMQLEELVELLPEEGGPELLVMELATGKERT